MAERVEITDLVRTWGPDGTRAPVEVAAVIDRLRASGQRRAARIVAAMPATDGLLDDAAADRMLVRVHCELQRLAEEFVQGRRVLEHLAPLVGHVAPTRGRPVRIVDVGCGLGYTVRWLAARAGWREGVELVGVDMDATLVARATRLADAEALPVEFVVGDAFAPGVAILDPARTIVISSGLLHHVPPAGLASFFAAQQDIGVHAFAHWDPAPGPWSVLGAWMFHRARMREPVSRHDGVLSVRRSHSADTLLRAARAGAPAYELACAPDPGWLTALTEVIRPVTGVRP